jgi:hypothetical protein
MISMTIYMQCVQISEIKETRHVLVQTELQPLNNSPTPCYPSLIIAKTEITPFL